MYGYETFHEKLMLDLIRAVRQGTARHAYIFEGAQGLGLYSSAMLFAAALCCGRGDAPCGACVPCTLSAAGTNPDIITIEKEKGKSFVSVDTVREAAEDAYIKPFSCGKKVYIIKDASLMTAQAQNAFLKTLEEPPEFAVFILIAEDADALLPTVLSRCVLVRFPPVSDDIVSEYTQKKYPDVENKEFLIKYAAGVPGNVDAVMEDETFMQLRADAFDALARVLSRRRIDSFEAAEFVDDRKDKAGVILELWMSFVRDILLLQNDCGDLVVNSDMMMRLSKAAGMIEKRDAAQVQQRLVRASEMIKRNVNARSAVLWAAL